MVQLLLERGANFNTQERAYGNALQAASIEGHVQIVQLLLDKGAHVDARNWRVFYSNALKAASTEGHVQIVQLLLDKGAHVDARNWRVFYSNALKAASRNGHNGVVQLLLGKGAVLDAESLKKSLREAKAEKYDRVVQLLQDHESTLHRELPVSEGT